MPSTALTLSFTICMDQDKSKNMNYQKIIVILVISSALYGFYDCASDITKITRDHQNHDKHPVTSIYILTQSYQKRDQKKHHNKSSTIEK